MKSRNPNLRKHKLVKKKIQDCTENRVYRNNRNRNKKSPNSKEEEGGVVCTLDLQPWYARSLLFNKTQNPFSLFIFFFSMFSCLIW